MNLLTVELTENIERADLQPVLTTHTGSLIFAEALAQIAQGQEMIRLLSHYVQFNSIFGSGVANLAGEFGARKDLFRDPAEPIDAIADRSVEVAADIFFAAIDEFGGAARRNRRTHRALAQATVKAAGEFFGYDPEDLNYLTWPNPATLEAVEQVRTGYGLSQNLDEHDLFQALGFHIGSELLADEEFGLLDRFLQTNYPGLVNHLKQAQPTINSVRYNAYQWVRVHTTVEADHFEAAVSGANRALRYYTGAASRAQIKQRILAGFATFSAVQTDFMRGLLAN